MTPALDGEGFTAKQALNRATLYNDGTIELKDVPDDIQEMPAFIQAVAEGVESQQDQTIMTDDYTASQIDLGDMGILKVGDKAYGILGDTGTGIVTQF